MKHTCPHAQMHRCPLYIASHAGIGCFGGGEVEQPCRVRRGECSYEAAWDEAIKASKAPASVHR